MPPPDLGLFRPSEPDEDRLKKLVPGLFDLEESPSPLFPLLKKLAGFLLEVNMVCRFCAAAAIGLLLFIGLSCISMRLPSLELALLVLVTVLELVLMFLLLSSTSPAKMLVGWVGVVTRVFFLLPRMLPPLSKKLAWAMNCFSLLLSPGPSSIKTSNAVQPRMIKSTVALRAMSIQPEASWSYASSAFFPSLYIIALKRVPMS
mmetsp:Transcript_12064/g.21904  ORF Transcript_12064/g.21904 Transcript_12064/m.21904 type:complete len:203 (-) Transcript_12064:1674-2282(-)